VHFEFAAPSGCSPAPPPRS